MLLYPAYPSPERPRSPASPTLANPGILPAAIVFLFFFLHFFFRLIPIENRNRKKWEIISFDLRSDPTLISFAHGDAQQPIRYQPQSTSVFLRKTPAAGRNGLLDPPTWDARFS